MNKKKLDLYGTAVDSSEKSEHCSSFTTAGFFSTRSRFFGLVWVSGFFSKKSGFILQNHSGNTVRKACRRRREYDVIFIRSNPNN